MIHFLHFLGGGVGGGGGGFCLGYLSERRQFPCSISQYNNNQIKRVISYSCHLLLDFHATTVVSRLKQFGGEFGSSSLRNLVIANKKRRSHPKTVPQCNSTKLGTSLTLAFKMTNNARTTTFRSGNVGDARKVFSHWSQKATTHHCLLSFPILNQLAFRVRGAATWL